jgi:S-adenosylhomocysteine hydrolase
VQALALAWLAAGEASLGAEGGLVGDAPRGGEVLDVPASIDAVVASLTLASLGTTIDALTDTQRRYLESWRRGS